MTAPAKASPWAEQAHRSLSDAGYNQGAARRAVIDLLDRQSCSLTVREIDDALHSEGQRVGRASVYRVLEQLSELGLVSRVEVGHAMARFEPVRPDHEHHHHMVCDSCGRVLPFADPGLERAIARVSDKVRFEVAGHDVVLRGECASCR